MRRIAEVGIVNAKADKKTLNDAADLLEALDERVAIMGEFEEGERHLTQAAGASTFPSRGRLLAAEELRDVQDGGGMYWFDFFQGGCYVGLIAVIEDIGARLAYPVLICEKNASVRRTYMENYGVSWRCWTARPTEEQRTETPWGLAQDDYDEHRFSGLLSEE